MVSSLVHTGIRNKYILHSNWFDNVSHQIKLLYIKRIHVDFVLKGKKSLCEYLLYTFFS